MLISKVEDLVGEEKKDTQEVWGLEEKSLLLLGWVKMLIISRGAGVTCVEDLQPTAPWGGPRSALLR